MSDGLVGPRGGSLGALLDAGACASAQAERSRLRQIDFIKHDYNGTTGTSSRPAAGAHAALSALIGARLPAPVESALERLLVLDRFQESLDRVQASSDCRPFLERTLSALNIQPQVSRRDLELVPARGPVVAVANHPFGLVEGAVLGLLLRSVRSDVKIVANHLLSAFPAAAEHCILSTHSEARTRFGRIREVSRSLSRDWSGAGCWPCFRQDK